MIRSGQAMPLLNVYRNFRRYLDKAGIAHTGHGPRVHDFRYPNFYKIQTFFKYT
jgi:integrase/recombinase XerD